MDLICYAHLRWNFVYQRPQHLLTRFAKDYRVFYVEEFEMSSEITAPILNIRIIKKNLLIVTPQFPAGFAPKEITASLQNLLVEMFNDYRIHPDIFWYYTPMAISFTKGFHPELVLYDCMDELSNFKFAPPELKILEAELFQKADIVFTGGHHLYSAKKNQHHNIWPVPSSIEKEHFMQARKRMASPPDQENIPAPRLGFYGVIDERFDIDLLKTSAEKRPDWHFVMIGPVIKIDPADLPQLPNIHYLGPKSYEELPAYLNGWQMALIPFLLNDATRYISPTKTPEYLAAGVPVLSTGIEDVINPYGKKGLAHIVATADELIEACQKELERKNRGKWLRDVDAFLSGNSWDNTWRFMKQRIEETKRKPATVIKMETPVLSTVIKTAVNV